MILGAIILCSSISAFSDTINREALVKRNNPHVVTVDTLASLTVGNGEFAYTVDVTGLQTFPRTISQWCTPRHSEPVGMAFFPQSRQFAS